MNTTLLIFLAAEAVTPVGQSPMIETSILAKLVEQLPAVAAIIIVVMIFIKFLESDRRVSREFYQQLHDAHLEARKESQTRIADNTDALKENVVATTRNTSMIADLSRIIDRLDRGREK